MNWTFSAQRHAALSGVEEVRNRSNCVWIHTASRATIETTTVTVNCKIGIRHVNAGNGIW